MRRGTQKPLAESEEVKEWGLWNFPITSFGAVGLDESSGDGSEADQITATTMSLPILLLHLLFLASDLNGNMLTRSADDPQL